MRVGHVELFVTDPIASKAFYEEVLGGEVVAVQGDRFVWMKFGEVELLLRHGSPDAPADAYGEGRVGVVFYTDDLPAKVAELKGRGFAFRGTDGSEHCHTFTDPDGHWFQLVDPSGHG